MAAAFPEEDGGAGGTDERKGGAVVKGHGADAVRLGGVLRDGTAASGAEGARRYGTTGLMQTDLSALFDAVPFKEAPIAIRMLLQVEFPPAGSQGKRAGVRHSWSFSFETAPCRQIGCGLTWAAHPKEAPARARRGPTATTAGNLPAVFTSADRANCRSYAGGAAFSVVVPELGLDRPRFGRDRLNSLLAPQVMQVPVTVAALVTGASRHW
ncbi:MAG: hypothetical protein NTZ05_14080 [Chloroflexi bacterium]|nr:hypothetical protein [Chloroflexota bacterium]